MSVTPGRTLGGKYHIGRLIARGGMGAVYEATHVSLASQVAVKVLDPRFAVDSNFQRRFAREATTVASLRHPHIVSIIEFASEDDCLYMVMELVPDGSLLTLPARYQQQTGQQLLPVLLTVELCRQAAEGLAYAHDHGVIHRDIKPANLLVEQVRGAGGTPHFMLKITDFGVARLTSGQASSHLSSSHFLGTPEYAAPEQLQQLPPDGKCDVFALGVVFYELLTGSLPGAGVAAVGPIVGPRTLRPTVSETLDRLVMTCLDRDPVHRPSADDLAAALTALQAASVPRAQSAPTIALPRAAAGGDNTLRTQVALPPLPSTSSVVKPASPATRPSHTGRLIAATLTLLLAGLVGFIWLGGGPGAAVGSMQTPEVLTTSSPTPGLTPTPADATPIASPLPAAGTGGDQQPAGESGQIAFISDRSGNPEIYIINSDGSGVRQLTSNGRVNRSPVWSPGGDKIAFSSGTSGQSDIYVMNADGTEQTRLTDGSSDNLTPTWSPDGNKIAFATLIAGGYQIQVMDADGTNVAQLTDTSSTIANLAPKWSPDGRSILFYSTRDQGDAEIYVMDSDGSDQRRVTLSPDSDGSPAWSPDGLTIAFDSRRSADTEIYRMSVLGDGVRNISQSPGADHMPSWSRDGSQIAFWSWRDGNAEIYLMLADGSGQRNLTRDPANDSEPSWRS